MRLHNLRHGAATLLLVRQRPTRRQPEMLRAYIVAGSIAAAAYELGIAEATPGNISQGCIGGLGA